MRLEGFTSNGNMLAVFLGALILTLCLALAYLFQTRLFNKYRRKVPNAVNNDDNEEY
jgi:hypothetical protein